MELVAVRRGVAFPFLSLWSAAARKHGKPLKEKIVTSSHEKRLRGGGGGGASFAAPSVSLAWSCGSGVSFLWGRGGGSARSTFVPFFGLGLRRLFVRFFGLVVALSRCAKHAATPSPAPATQVKINVSSWSFAQFFYGCLGRRRSGVGCALRLGSAPQLSCPNPTHTLRYRGKGLGRKRASGPARLRPR